MPKLNNQGRLNLVKARHPLLKVKKVIPNNVSFGEEYLGIIVTGPNTGGKTVLLKTVGLLCTMVKYGLLGIDNCQRPVDNETAHWKDPSNQLKTNALFFIPFFICLYLFLFRWKLRFQIIVNR